MNGEKEYYIATKGKDKKFLIYITDNYKFSELDFLNLIKICILDRRNKSLGRKMLSVYEDSSEDAEENLKKIGFYNNDEKPIKRKSPKYK